MSSNQAEVEPVALAALAYSDAVARTLVKHRIVSLEDHKAMLDEMIATLRKGTGTGPAAADVLESVIKAQLDAEFPGK